MCLCPQASTPGALTIDAMCQEGAFVIDNISYYGDAKVGTELTAEADWKRRGFYLGPQVRRRSSAPASRAALTSPRAQFDTLDVSLQDEFEKFLQERGINQSLAYFVPEYAEFKEQKVRARSFSSWHVC